MDSSRKMNGRFSVGSLRWLSEVFAGVVGPQQIGVKHTEKAQVSKFLKPSVRRKAQGLSEFQFLLDFTERARGGIALPFFSTTRFSPLNIG